MIQTIKSRINIIMDHTGAPAYTWLLCSLYVCFLLNHTFSATINGIPMSQLHGNITNISVLLHFHFYKEVYYKVDDGPFPSKSTEAIVYMVGIAENVGHRLTCKILTKDTHRVVARSELRPVKSGPNRRLDFLSGEDSVGGQKIKTFVRSSSDQPNDGSEQPNKPVTVLADLIGKTFLMDKQEDGQKHRARITELVEGHQKDIEQHPDRIKFKVSMNNDKFEDLLSHRQVQ